MKLRTIIAASAALLAPVVSLHAQVDARTQPELRADVVAIGSRVAVQAGGGVQVPFGVYTRLGVIAAAGADLGRFEQDASGRLDVLARFLFDPFRQTRWGVSAGGGVTVRARSREGVRPFLTAVMDVEGPRTRRGFSPALQLGIGGGIRLGGALRWGTPATR